MSRTLTWKHTIAEIRRRLENSVIETWSRRDIENLERTTSQQLMKAIAGVQNMGKVYLIDGTSLLGFVEQLEQIDHD